MSDYTVLRTDTADEHIHKIILYIAEEFGPDVALKKLEELEQEIMSLSVHPNIGIEPRYATLRRRGYKILVLDKNLVFYKIEEKRKEVTVYAVIDHRQDYRNIINGL